MMPRFPAAEMPAVPPARGGGAGRGGGPAGAEPHLYLAPKGKALSVPAPGLAGIVAGATALTTPAATVAMGTAPAHGKVELKADGSFTYTPERGFSGTDTFTYTTTRAGVTSAPGTVTVIVP